MTPDFDPDERYRTELELRDMRREVEAAEEQLERNTRPVGDVFVEFMERGDLVEMAVGSHRYAGYVVGVGADLVTLDVDGRRADVSLSQLTVARVVAARPGAGRAFGASGTESVLARLRELAGAQAGTIAELAGADFGLVVATVIAVSAAHVELTTSAGEHWVVPVSSIGAVVTSPE